MSEHDPNPATPEHEPTSYREMRSSAYIGADDLQGRPAVLTVVKVVTRELLTEKGEPEVRGVVRFKEARKELIVNVTNAMCLAAMFGDNPQNLVGKRVTIAPEMDRLQGKTVPCVRVVGSPDIERDMDVPIKLPRKATKVRRLTRTVAK
jgi:hypothetical protein